MTRLSHIASETRRLLGRMPETKLHNLQDALVELCEAHWREIRGPEPADSLAHALWTATPTLADLYIDLYRLDDMRLEELLDRLDPLRGMAALVLAEIERGDAEGIHVAYETLMILQTPAAAQDYAACIAQALRGELKVKKRRRKTKREPLCKALITLVDQTGRHDLKAITETMRLLADNQAAADQSLNQLRTAIAECGIEFSRIEDDHVHFNLHERQHKPLRLHRILDLLLEIRQARIG